MKKLLLVLLLCYSASIAQTSVNQVIVLNEGYYNWSTGQQDVPVSIGAYNPSLQTYSTFETINGAQFASDVLVSDNYIYAACSNGLRMYDKTTKQLLHTNTATGIRKMAIWNNELLVTRGDIGLSNNYYQSYSATDLSFNYELDNLTGPVMSTEGIAVYGDSCYVAINNSFNFPNYVGKIGVIYLPTHTYVREFDLGPNGINPDYLAINNDEIYTVNNRDFTNASITKYNISNGSISTTDLVVSSGCGTSVYTSNEILFQVMGEQTLKKFNTNSLATYDSLMINQSVYGMAYDKVNDLIYAGITDFSTFGRINIYNNTGMMIDSFVVGVSPGNIAIDYNNALAVTENQAQVLSCYPNPAYDILNVIATSTMNVAIYNSTGQLIISSKLLTGQNKIDLSMLKNGVYIMKNSDSANPISFRFQKQ